MSTTDSNIAEAPASVDPVASVDPSELLDASETAALLRQKTQTLAAWRCERRGPPYLKIGRAVYYRRSAIHEWLAQQIVRPSAA